MIIQTTLNTTQNKQQKILQLLSLMDHKKYNIMHKSIKIVSHDGNRTS